MSVLLGTPTAILGAFLALTLRGFQNNVYVQIGLIMLIGLAAKNAILIIAFAKTEYEKGKSIAEAALTGARIRLRPILMTSFAFILGCLPLWLASGSGGVSRQTLGTVVIGGMLGATFVDIFIVPVTFSIVEKAVARISKKTRGSARRETAGAERMKKLLQISGQRPKVCRNARHVWTLGRWALVVWSWLLAGCAVGPNYQRPAHQRAGHFSRRNRKLPPTPSPIFRGGRCFTTTRCKA